jgi:hypothetical protein
MKSIIFPNITKLQQHRKPSGFKKVRELSDRLYFNFGKKEAYEVLNSWLGNEFDRNALERDGRNIVTQYREAMSEKRFCFQNVTIMACLVGGVLYRINGQHVCHAMLGMAENISCTVRVVLLEADTIDEMRDFFIELDGTVRKKIDEIRSQLVNTEQYSTVSDKNLGLLTDGYKSFVRDLMDGFHERKTSNRTACAYMRQPEVAKNAVRINNLIGSQQSDKQCGHGHIYRNAVISLFAWIAEFFPNDLDKFVNGVKTGANMSNDDARFVYREFLRIRTADAPRAMRHTGWLIVGLYAFILWKKNQKIGTINKMKGILDKVGTGSVKRYANSLLREFGIDVPNESDDTESKSDKVVVSKRTTGESKHGAMKTLILDRIGTKGETWTNLQLAVQEAGFSPLSVSAAVSRLTRNNVLVRKNGKYFLTK